VGAAAGNSKMYFFNGNLYCLSKHIELFSKAIIRVIFSLPRNSFLAVRTPDIALSDFKPGIFIFDF